MRAACRSSGRRRRLPRWRFACCWGFSARPAYGALFLDEREVRRDAGLKENRRRRRAEAFARKAEQRAEKAARAARTSS